MRLQHKVLIVVLSLLVLVIPAGMASAATTVYSPTITSTPMSQWYNNTPYSYVINASQPAYFSLKTNSTLQLLYSGSYNSTQASVFGTILTTKQVNSYWVNISLKNSTKIFSWQNYTLTVYNEPFIYSVPKLTFVPGSVYVYRYVVNQIGTVTLAPIAGFYLNTTNDTLWGTPLSSIMLFSLKITNSNGTYTQIWEISQILLTSWTISMVFGVTHVNATVPLSLIGVTNNTLKINGQTISTFPTNAKFYTLVVNLFAGTPNEYTITSSTTSNGPVELSWSGLLPYTSYNLTITNNGQMISSRTISSSATGTYSTYYNSTSMPLDPTFQLTSLLPPTSPPTPPSSNTNLILTLSIIAIIVVGVVVPLLFYGDRKR